MRGEIEKYHGIEGAYSQDVEGDENEEFDSLWSFSYYLIDSYLHHYVLTASRLYVEETPPDFINRFCEIVEELHSSLEATGSADWEPIQQFLRELGDWAAVASFE